MNRNTNLCKLGLLMAVPSLWYACADSGLFTTAPNRANPKTYTIQLSEWTLSLDAPGGHRNEVWDRPNLQNINLDWNKELEAKKAIQAFNVSWQYTGFLTEGLFGTLRLKVWVLPRAMGYSNNLLRNDELESYIHDHDRQLWDPKNDEYLRRGQKNLIIVMPQKYDRLKVQGREWVCFRYGGQFDFYGCAIGLREDRFVQVEFDFIDNAGGKKRQDWRADAERLRGEIAGTLRLEQRPKQPM